ECDFEVPLEKIFSCTNGYECNAKFCKSCYKKKFGRCFFALEMPKGVLANLWVLPCDQCFGGFLAINKVEDMEIFVK
ncbi:hypothetical protein ACFLY6_01970, partial [Candidatus Dependentiae bacterium]